MGLNCPIGRRKPYRLIATVPYSTYMPANGKNSQNVHHAFPQGCTTANQRTAIHTVAADCEHSTIAFKGNAQT